MGADNLDKAGPGIMAEISGQWLVRVAQNRSRFAVQTFRIRRSHVRAIWANRASTDSNRLMSLNRARKSTSIGRP